MLYHKKDLFTTVTPPNNYFWRLSDHLHRTNRPFTYALRKVMFTLSRRLKRTPFRKNFLNEISRKSNLNRTTWPPGNWDQEPIIFRKPEAVPINSIIAAVTVYLPVWHWHCTRANFTVPVSCNGEIAVRSYPLLDCRGRLRNFPAGCYTVGLFLRNNNTAINLQTFTSSYCGRRFSACDQGPTGRFSTQICLV